jgi:hypothetical protein
MVLGQSGLSSDNFDFGVFLESVGTGMSSPTIEPSDPFCNRSQQLRLPFRLFLGIAYGGQKGLSWGWSRHLSG